MEKLLTAHLVPQPGLIIRDPGTKKILLESGEVKTLVGKDGRYWKRQLRDGSVTIKAAPNIIRTKVRKQIEDKED